MLRRSPTRRWRPLIAASTVALAAGAWISVAAGPASSGSISGTFYRDPNSQAARWVAANPNDPRAARIGSVIANQPLARWFATVNVSTAQNDVAAYVGAANARNEVAQLVIYGMPNRDCGGPSAGGAPNFQVWQQWITNIAAGLGNRLVLVLMEPDAVALTTCLTSAGVTERYNNIRQAVTTIKSRNPQAKVYLDAGHSAWHPASVIAGRLDSAGVRQSDGFYTNPSNYRRTETEVAYGQSILSALGNPANVKQVVDTSRNGNGPSPVNPQPNGWADWCDYQNARVGLAPTTNTGFAHVDAFVWIKPPGEADGCAAAPGTFLPDFAFRYAEGGAPGPTATATQPPTQSPTRSPTPSGSTSSPPPPSSSTTSSSTTSSAPAPAGGCTLQYDVPNQWSAGFVSDVTIVNNGASAVNGWTLAFSFAGTERVTSMWNATFTPQNGQRVEARNAAHNALIGAGGGTATFGFQGSLSGGTAVDPISATLNGTACRIT